MKQCKLEENTPVSHVITKNKGLFNDDDEEIFENNDSKHYYKKMFPE